MYPEVDSFNARVRSSIGWMILSPSADWFSHIRPMNTWPAEIGRDTFDFSQFNRAAYPVVYDSLYGILQEFEVEARSLIREGPYPNNPAQPFRYELILNNTVNALAFLNRLKSWAVNNPSLDQYAADYTASLFKKRVISVDNDSPETRVWFYADQQLHVENEYPRPQDVTIVNSAGFRVLKMQIDPGQTSIAMPNFPGIIFCYCRIQCLGFIKSD